MSKSAIQSMRRSVRQELRLYATQLNSKSAQHRMSVSAPRLMRDNAVLVLSSNVQPCMSKIVRRNIIGSARQPLNNNAPPLMISYALQFMSKNVGQITSSSVQLLTNSNAPLPTSRSVPP